MFAARTIAKLTTPQFCDKNNFAYLSCVLHDFITICCTFYFRCAFYTFIAQIVDHSRCSVNDHCRFSHQQLYHCLWSASGQRVGLWIYPRIRKLSKGLTLAAKIGDWCDIMTIWSCRATWWPSGDVLRHNDNDHLNDHMCLCSGWLVFCFLFMWFYITYSFKIYIWYDQTNSGHGRQNRYRLP